MRSTFLVFFFFPPSLWISLSDRGIFSFKVDFPYLLWEDARYKFQAGLLLYGLIRRTFFLCNFQDQGRIDFESSLLD